MKISFRDGIKAHNLQLAELTLLQKSLFYYLLFMSTRTKSFIRPIKIFNYNICRLAKDGTIYTMKQI